MDHFKEVLKLVEKLKKQTGTLTEAEYWDIACKIYQTTILAKSMGIDKN